MEDEPIIIAKTKVKLINPKKQKKEEEQKESFNMNNQNSKITKLQEDNINGNYSRIYIQEGPKKKLIYEVKEELPPDKNDTRLKDYNIKNYSKENENNRRGRYTNGLQNNEIKKNTKRKEDKNKNNHLRRKSIDRGGNYKNVQVTHIIDSALDIDFHIIDPLDISTDESRNKFKVKINKSNRNGKNGNVRVKKMSSCDNIKIRPKEKKKNIGKIEHVVHRENPHLKKINIKNVNNMKSSSMISNQRYNKPLNKNVRK